MTRRFTSEIINEIGPEKDIPAPDVGTDASVMAWIFDTYSMNKGHSVLGVVTGKPLAIGGSLGREEATARGALYVITDALQEEGKGLEGLRVAVQGFGNVGRHLARMLAEEGALSSPSPTRRWAARPKGSTFAGVLAHKAEHGMLAGFSGGDAISNEELLLLECDVLAPCALEQVISAANAAQVKARIICEGANGPATPGRRRDPRGPRRARPPGRARERGRCRRLLLRVGAGPAGVLLEGGRGQRAARTTSSPAPSARPGRRASARRRACAWPPTGSPCGVSPRRRVTRGLYP